MDAVLSAGRPTRRSPPGGGRFRRSVSIDPLYYNEDGTLQRVIMTTEGLDRVRKKTKCKCAGKTCCVSE